MADRFWYACSEPERPTDAFVQWHYRGCLGCFVKADALAHIYPDDSHVRWLHELVVVGDAHHG